MREHIRGHTGLDYDRYKLHLEIVDVDGIYEITLVACMLHIIQYEHMYKKIISTTRK